MQPIVNPSQTDLDVLRKKNQQILLIIIIKKFHVLFYQIQKWQMTDITQTQRTRFQYKFDNLSMTLLLYWSSFVLRA